MSDFSAAAPSNPAAASKSEVNLATSVECGTCGPVVQVINPRISALETGWSNFGYPLEIPLALVNDEPASKKIKLEDTATENIEAFPMPASEKSSCSYSISELSKRITALEKQWKTYFGDIEPKSPAATGQSKIGTSMCEAEADGIVRKDEPAMMAVKMEDHAADDDDGRDIDGEDKTNEKDEPSPSQSRFTCPKCPIICKTFADINKHMGNSHSHFNKLKPCTICGQLFLSQKDRRRHKMAAHIHKPTFTCTRCGKSCKHMHSLDDHIRNTHGILSIKTCPECGVKIDNRNKVISHVLEHQATTERKLLWQCEKCPNSRKQLPRYYLTEAEVKEHEAIIHVHQCFVCGQKFKDQQILLEHKRAEHKNSESTSAAAKGHGETSVEAKDAWHSAFVPSQCKCPKCPTICSTFPDINKHMASIHSHFQNLLPCAICRALFFDNKARKRHSRLTHKSSFTCPQCGKYCNYNQGLLEHLRSRHRIQTNKACPECGVELVVPKQFISHMLKHKTTTAEEVLTAM